MEHCGRDKDDEIRRDLPEFTVHRPYNNKQVLISQNTAEEVGTA